MLKFVILIGILIDIGLVVFFSKVFIKAGQPWWGVLVPFYNAYLYSKITGKPRWWFWIVLCPIMILILYSLQALLCHPTRNVIQKVAYWSGNAIFLTYIVLLMLKMNVNFGRRFQKRIGFGIGLTLLPPVFGAILAFDGSTYERKGLGSQTKDRKGGTIDFIQRKWNIVGICISSFAILFLVGSSLGQRAFLPSPTDYTYSIPSTTDDGWKTASLEEVGLDRSIIELGVLEINKGTYGAVHSFLIVRYGKLVLEEYWSGNAYINTYFLGICTDFDKDTIHNLASVTKSITSALVGIAVDRGDIDSVDEKVMTYLPEYEKWAEEGKEDITIKHLLTMTSGLEWDEFSYSFLDPRNHVVQLFFSLDPFRYILNKPLLHEPGTQFHYNSGCTILLGEIIKRATGLRMDRFAHEYLFGPLGIRDYKWRKLAPNVVYASGDLKLRPRDMAKFGYLFMQGGTWNGRQIISQKWIEESTARHVTPADALSGYGYQWQMLRYQDKNLSRELYIYFASGYGGQWIIVVPELSMVVVITAGNYGNPKPIVDLCPDYVFTSVMDQTGNEK